MAPAGNLPTSEPSQALSFVTLLPGTVRRLTPRFSTDYPRTLSAHDIGLKDSLDAFYLLDHPVDVVLFAISIPPLQDMGLDLSLELAARVPEIAELIRDEIKHTA